MNAYFVNADLHCHSTVSDGTMSPEDVAALAAKGGVTLWSLTDHDEIGGQARAAAAAEAHGIRYVSGVEISVTWAKRTLHIVGLNVDPEHPTLARGLTSIRGGRQSRARLIGDKLAAMGIHGAYDGALRYVSNPDLISRTHFARFLVERGVAANTADVFRRFLSEGRPGYVAHRWASLGDAMAWIQAAGGTAVIAHPGRYQYTDLEFAALFDEFRQRGGDAIEVITGSHTPDQYVAYARVARQYGFRASRGSDFHGMDDGRNMPGTLPPLPTDLVPVWKDWI
ncbi:3',5'-nucleoside bisphosphate phosphatase [Robbsia andropogonis]|uniref:3',5'-nucleoside bisphosphate phosphatase n=1 Tax=Robbsia andropogonis TaxID=28092 RepID=UPI003D202BF7